MPPLVDTCEDLLAVLDHAAVCDLVAPDVGHEDPVPPYAALKNNIPLVVPPKGDVGDSEVYSAVIIRVIAHKARADKVLLDKSAWERSKYLKVEEILEEEKLKHIKLMNHIRVSRKEH